jgi:hypothetical protein
MNRVIAALLASVAPAAAAEHMVMFSVAPDCCTTTAQVRGVPFSLDSGQRFWIPQSWSKDAIEAGYHPCGRYGCEQPNERR